MVSRMHALRQERRRFGRMEGGAGAVSRGDVRGTQDGAGYAIDSVGGLGGGDAVSGGDLRRLSIG